MCFQDTFLDAQHLRESFPEYEVEIVNNSGGSEPVRPFRVTFPVLPTVEEDAAPKKRKAGQANGVATAGVLFFLHSPLSDRHRALPPFHPSSFGGSKGNENDPCDA